MRLTNLLKEKKATILDAWFDRIAKTYPKETASFFHRQKDPFANPVRHAFVTSTEQILDHLLAGSPKDSFYQPLEDILKIRAVQEFSPSQAVGFLFLFKTAIRQTLKKELKDAELLAELLDFESMIDGLSLIGFDIYMKCREKIYDIRATELRGRTKSFMQRLQRMTDTDGQPPYEIEEMEENLFQPTSTHQGGEK